MKYTNREDIKAFCDKYAIKNYTITKELFVDVDGDVYLNNKNLTELPFEFGKIKGTFDCSGNELKTLEGAPYRVGLNKSPKSVGKYNANGNLLLFDFDIDGDIKIGDGVFLLKGSYLSFYKDIWSILEYERFSFFDPVRCDIDNRYIIKDRIEYFYLLNDMDFGRKELNNVKRKYKLL